MVIISIRTIYILALACVCVLAGCAGNRRTHGVIRETSGVIQGVVKLPGLNPKARRHVEKVLVQHKIGYYMERTDFEWGNEIYISANPDDGLRIYNLLSRDAKQYNYEVVPLFRIKQDGKLDYN